MHPAFLVRVVALLVAVVLLGAAAFGVWHVVVGGLVSGNPRAAAFGATLAGAALGLLGIGALVVRRLVRGDRAR